ncbi:hypothetical protein MCEGE11_01682 [Sphingomonadaceae bacterium]
MGFIAYVAWFMLGMFLGIIYFSTVLLPLINGLPKSLYLAMRGELRWRSPFKYVFAASAWFIGFVLVGFAATSLSPDIMKSFEENEGRVLGSIVGVVVCFWRTAMNPSVQEDMAADFARFTSNDLKKERFDKNKSTSLQASRQSYNNLVYSAVTFTFIILINQWLGFSAVKYISIFIIYAFTIANSIDFLFKVFGVIMISVMNFVDVYKKIFEKDYPSWRIHAGGDDYPGIPETIVGVFILAMNLATLYMAYIALNTVSPDRWNIYHSLGL